MPEVAPMMIAFLIQLWDVFDVQCSTGRCFLFHMTVI
jgi:hypothetical protein